MPTLLVRSAEVLAQMDDARTELADAGMFIRDGWIEQVGPTSMLPATADEVIDLKGHVVLPGLVNTHHHLYQTLSRALPAAQDAGLFDWLRALYPVWARMTPDHIKVSTRLGLVELAMSGCTTAFDHHYLWPGATSLADQFEGADPVGIRFHASRGSMSLGESGGGLPPDSVVEEESAILSDSADAIDRFHQPEPGAMKRVVLAPCSPFSVTTDLMRESAAIARERGVTLHTHLAETRDEEAFCRDRFGVRPVELMEQLDWNGPDVWYAHAVHVDPQEVDRMAAAGTGVAHCPTSNMRLASGTAPLARYLRQGVKVGLGVDGSASNDSSHLLAEVRQAMLLARLAAAEEGSSLLEARTALAVATRGGAAVLGRDDIGSLEPGKAADFIAIDLNRIEFAGALHDPVAAVVFCAPVRVDHSWVQGRRVIEDGRPVGVELPALIERHNRLAAELVV
jgi:cytosine/adenosine deaminase-related metal-dependent hydrolase